MMLWSEEYQTGFDEERNSAGERASLFKIEIR